MTVAVPAPPSAQEVATALEKDPSKVETVYAAEKADQARRCHVDPYNDSLARALVRRCQRALAMADLPLGVQMAVDGAVRIGSTDPEVRRLEGPYRKTPLG